MSAPPRSSTPTPPARRSLPVRTSKIISSPQARESRESHNSGNSVESVDQRLEAIERAIGEAAAKHESVEQRLGEVAAKHDRTLEKLDDILAALAQGGGPGRGSGEVSPNGGSRANSRVSGGAGRLPALRKPSISGNGSEAEVDLDHEFVNGSVGGEDEFALYTPPPPPSPKREGSAAASTSGPTGSPSRSVAHASSFDDEDEGYSDDDSLVEKQGKEGYEVKQGTSTWMLNPKNRSVFSRERKCWCLR